MERDKRFFPFKDRKAFFPTVHSINKLKYSSFPPIRKMNLQKKRAGSGQTAWIPFAAAYPYLSAVFKYSVR